MAQWLSLRTVSFGFGCSEQIYTVLLRHPQSSDGSVDEGVCSSAVPNHLLEPKRSPQLETKPIVTH